MAAADQKVHLTFIGGVGKKWVRHVDSRPSHLRQAAFAKATVSQELRRNESADRNRAFAEATAWQAEVSGGVGR